MVVVLGMHRSGTSAVTQLLEAAGLTGSQPDRRYSPSRWNAHGNHENRHLSTFNERLLVSLGGRWDAPPALPPGWERQPVAVALRSAARRTFEREMRATPWVWKDPRLCLLLPFWDRVMTEATPVVLVRRHPVEIAESLAQRNGFPRQLGLGLWERYLRTALVVTKGHPAVVVGYEAALADPVSFVEQTRSELTTLGVKLGSAAAHEVVRAAIDPALQHADTTTDDSSFDSLLTNEQRALTQVLDRLPVIATAFPPIALGSESPSTQRLIAEHGRLVRDDQPSKSRPVWARLRGRR